MVTIHDRVIADLGLPGFDIQEPALGVSRSRRLGAAQKPSAGGPMRAVLATSQSSSWTAQEVLPPGPAFHAVDASIALVDGPEQKFVLFGLNGAFSSGGKIRYSTWTPASSFTHWRTAYAGTQNNCGPSAVVIQDKPWVLRRAQDDFFMFFWAGCRFRYLRTSDGMNWGDVDTGNPDPIYDVPTAAPEEPVLASFCCHPSAAADGSVFLAHATGTYGMGGKIRVLIGVDPEGDGAGALTFTYAKQIGGEPAEISPRFSQGSLLPVPNPAGQYKSATVPTIACDPSDPDWAHIVYHDVAEDDPMDVNVYIASLHRIGGHWDFVPPHPVHDEVLVDGVNRASQCTPVLAVDSRGWIHILYYDNRSSYEPEPGAYETDQYDAWYALSTDHGATFRRSNLRTSGDALPAMDLGLQLGGIGSNWSPREYNCIGIYESGTETRVWVLYSGTSDEAADDPARRTVFFGQQIVVTLEEE